MANILVIGSLAESLINFRGPLLQAMVDRGHTVAAAAPCDNREVVEQLSRMGVAYHRFPLARTGMNPVRDLLTIRRLRRLMAEVRPDVLLCYTIKPVIYGSLVAKRCGVGRVFSIITGRGYAFSGQGGKSCLAKFAATMLYGKALVNNARVFFQNPDDRDYFIRANLVYEDQAILVNGSGVDLDRFSQVPLPQSPSFVMIARLIEDKGVREYVAAARRIRRTYHDVSFKLVGWIDNNPKAIRQAELDSWVEEGIIEYVGRLQDVRPAFAAASVFVLPTYYPEGTPRTVLEAMAMGRPVITTDMPGCRETVRSGWNGFLVPPHDVDAVAAAMERLLVEPGLIEAMGRYSRQRAKEKYDVHKVNAVVLQAMGLDTHGVAGA